MSRRTALIALLSIPFGAFGYRHTEAAGAVLTIPLDQWTGFIVKHGGKAVTISSAEIFDVLCRKEER